MARYSLEMTEETVISIDTGPGAMLISSLELSWKVNTPEELARAVVELGFDAAEMSVTKDLQSRWSMPVTLDGEQVAFATIHLWIGEELSGQKSVPPIAALVDIVDAAKQKRAAEETERVLQSQVDWANEHGRNVALVGGKIEPLDEGARVDEEPHR